MNSDELEEVLAQARQIRHVFTRVYEEVTGEELDLESAVRHGPLMALSLAAGIGVLAGWWLGRRESKQLPASPPHSAPDPLGRIEQLLPTTVDQIRQNMPEISVPREVREAAKDWMGTVLEPKLRQNIEGFSARVDGVLKQAFCGPDQAGDIKLDDEDASLT